MSRDPFDVGLDVGLDPDLVPDPADELGLLGDAVAENAPPLRAPIMAQVRARPRQRPAPFGAVESVASVIDDLGALLATLSPAEWAATHALGDLSVRDTVSHLTGADLYLGVKVGAWPGTIPADESDHFATTGGAIEEGCRLSDAQLLARWRRIADGLVVHLRAIDDTRLGEASRYCMIEGPLHAILIARAFEMWTHTEDICRAAGRPCRPPRTEVLAAMTDIAAELVPLGYALEPANRPSTATLRLVLTGAGGGTWDRNLSAGLPAGEPDIVLVADTVEFCRLVAMRLAPSEIDCDIIGDEALGELVLAGCTKFAMD